MSAINEYFAAEQIHSYVNQRLSKYKSSGVSKKTKEQYLKTIHSLMRRDSQTSSTPEETKMMQAVENIIMTKYPGAIIEQTEGIISGKILQNSNQNAQFKQWAFGGKYSNKTTNQYHKKINQLVAVLEAQLKNGSVDKAQIEQANQELQKILIDLNEIDNDLNKTGIIEGNILNRLNANVEQFNTLLTGLGLAKIATRLAQGDFFEHTLAAAALLINEEAQEIAEEELEKKIAEFVIGDQKITSTVEFFKHSKRSKSFAITDSDIASKGIMSQGKIDVTLTYNTPSGKKSVGISAKSYSQIVHLQVVTGTSLAAILSHENANFQESILYALYHKNKNAPWQTEVQLALKVLIAYKGLTGDILGREMAKLFIVNDVNTKTIYLLEMADIIKALNQDFSTVNQYFGGFKKEILLNAPNPLKEELLKSAYGVAISAYLKGQNALSKAMSIQ